MKQSIITIFIIAFAMWGYGELCKQQILSQPITCTAERVVLSGKHYDNADVRGLTCNGQSVTLGELGVGRIVSKSNKRVMGMVKQREGK